MAHELIGPWHKKPPVNRKSIILKPLVSGEDVAAIIFFGAASSDPE